MGDNRVVVGRFLKVLMSGFETTLNIPVRFITALNNEDVNISKAVLKSFKGSWEVGVVRNNEGLLQFSGQAWERFVAEHELEVGKVILFEHVGRMRFNTIMFGENCCEMGFATLEDEDEHNSDEGVDNLQFEKTISQHNLNVGFMNVPIAFARANDLMSNGTVSLRTNTGGSWLATLLVAGVNDTRTSRQIRVYISGLTSFIRQNDLKVGDQLLFKLVSFSRNPSHVVMDVAFVGRQ